jgi:pimeloyl-ACP methyl ester carboxylesterase
MKYWIVAILVTTLLSCQKEKISIGAAANETFYVQNGSGSQRVQVRGNTASGKMVLTVHGGPGGSSYYLSYLKAMQERIEKQVAVAYLDQPIAGASQSNGVSYGLDEYATGIQKAIAVLKHRYGKDQKIILFSESWGGIVATTFLTTGNNQRQVAGWINADGPHDFHLQDREIVKMAILEGSKQIALGNNVAQWQPIVDYCRANDPTNNYTVAKKLNSLLGDAEYLMDSVVRVEFSTPNIMWSQAQTNQAPFTASLLNLFNNNLNQVEKEAYKKRHENSVSVIQTPLLLLWGKYDFIAPPAVGDSLYNKVQSTQKQKVILTRSGHNGFLQQPEVFWPACEAFIRSL